MPASTQPEKITIGNRTFTVLFPALVPPLTTDEAAYLATSIAEHGILDRVHIDEDGGIIDGINRLRIAAVQGLAVEDVPFEVHSHLTLPEKEQLALTLNLDRRQLKQEDVGRLRRERIDRVARLRREGKRLRAIAEEEGVSKTQVAEDLKAATVQGCTVEAIGGKVNGKDGKARPATRAKPEKKPEPVAAKPAVVATPARQTTLADFIQDPPGSDNGPYRAVASPAVTVAAEEADEDPEPVVVRDVGPQPGQFVDPGYGDPRAPVGTAEWAKRWRLSFQNTSNHLPFGLEGAAKLFNIGVEHNAWSLLTDGVPTVKHPGGTPFATFDDFCKCRQPYGLGADPVRLRAYLTVSTGEPLDWVRMLLRDLPAQQRDAVRRELDLLDKPVP